ncbi:hypothetical protein C8F04DRAFT_230293 [Mycena alexandri]|uniref:Uncharacterized protein n=1 Tax=Mycena alexandri TaxID=1745969 RepID=A0AAD6WS02_9AGAR|nr:hypothetical protein C8F04DRAFT_230293 [Mycena alexandri]
MQIQGKRMGAYGAPLSSPKVRRGQWEKAECPSRTSIFLIWISCRWARRVKASYRPSTFNVPKSHILKLLNTISRSFEPSRARRGKPAKIRTSGLSGVPQGDTRRIGVNSTRRRFDLNEEDRVPPRSLARTSAARSAARATHPKGREVRRETRWGSARRGWSRVSLRAQARVPVLAGRSCWSERERVRTPGVYSSRWVRIGEFAPERVRADADASVCMCKWNAPAKGGEPSASYFPRLPGRRTPLHDERHRKTGPDAARLGVSSRELRLEAPLRNHEPTELELCTASSTSGEGHNTNSW